MVRDVKGAGALAGVECELVRGDVTEPASLPEAVAGCDAVVHLVAILSGGPRGLRARDGAGDTQPPGCRTRGGYRALGADERARHERGDEGSRAVLRAKWDAETAVRESGLPHVILRPSFVFGPDGGALPRFARIARLAPVTPIVGPGTQRLQPIWVDDVAEVIARCARGEQSGLLQVGGPDVVTWNEFWSRLKVALGTAAALVAPAVLVHAPAGVRARTPSRPLLTRDQLKMLGAGDNVAEPNDALRFGLPLVPLDEQLGRAVRRAERSPCRPRPERRRAAADRPGSGRSSSSCGRRAARSGRRASTPPAAAPALSP